ncbi:MAG: hypothetical protein Q9222_004662 [Ikaeria aurantiellina]
MKTFTISVALALFTSLASASPVATKPEARQFEAFITFYGADTDAYFTKSIPTDGSGFVIYNPLSISHIGSAGGATCSFFGIDGSETEVVGAQVVDVGPPQTQISGYCVAL